MFQIFPFFSPFSPFVKIFRLMFHHLSVSVCASRFCPGPDSLQGRGCRRWPRPPAKKSVGPAASAASGPRQSGKLEAGQGSGTGTRTRLDPKGRVPEVEAPPATGDSVGQSSEASRLPGESVLHDRVLLSLR